jgi:hypothetical protein
MFEYFLPSGFIHTPTAQDPRWGLPEIVLYNPNLKPCEAVMIVYFSDRPPVKLPTITIKAETNELIVMPDIAPTTLTDAGWCGFKVSSSGPLMINHINGQRRIAPKPQFRGGCTNFHGRRLATNWRIPDGLWLEWNMYFKGDLTKAPFPFNESEFYHFLNPHPQDVHMEMTIRYRRKEPELHSILLKAERVWVWDNLGQVEPVHGYTIFVKSNAPIAVEAVRNIYGLTGLDEWGLTVHCAMFAIAGLAE